MGSFKKEKECKGCLSYNEGNGLGLHCTLRPISKDGEQCPCITCIVKMMCVASDDECRDYYEFGHRQHKLDNPRIKTETGDDQR